MTPPLRFVGINFDHMHMGDLLRMVFNHPGAEIAGICDEDPRRMASAIRNFNIAPERVFTDWRRCVEVSQADAVILCPATAHHAEYVEKIAPFGLDLLVEKPFAATLAEADRMIAATQKAGVRLAINWPLRWYPGHVTAYRLLREGRIGMLEEVHFYDGNRGPLWHAADKIETIPTIEEKQKSWFYKAAAGGGSLLDYLGYGVTLGTWYHGGRKPLEVTATSFAAPGIEVDEQSITICRYDCGLSKFETRWGTFTDPWTHQPQPKCGFVLKGTGGSLSSFDLEPTVRLQTAKCLQGEEIPVDDLTPLRNPIEYFVHCVREGVEFEGPLSPSIARIGQQIVDSAVASIAQMRTVALIG